MRVRFPLPLREDGQERCCSWGFDRPSLAVFDGKYASWALAPRLLIGEPERVMVRFHCFPLGKISPVVDTWSRKPGHPTGWGFDSSVFRVPTSYTAVMGFCSNHFHPATAAPLYVTGVGKPPLPGSNASKHQVMQGACKALASRHGRFDTFCWHGSGFPHIDTERTDAPGSGAAFTSRVGLVVLDTGFSIRGYGFDPRTRCEQREAYEELRHFDLIAIGRNRAGGASSPAHTNKCLVV
jgi:hypothetical protein